MQVKTIKYSRLVSTRQFENETYEMVADISFNEDPEQEMATLKHMVDRVIQGNVQSFNNEISNEPIDYGTPQDVLPQEDSLDHIPEPPAEDNDEFTQADMNEGDKVIIKDSGIPELPDGEYETSPPKLEDIVEKHGIKKASEIEPPTKKEIEDKLAEAEKRQREKELPVCEVCNGEGLVPDPEAEDPLETMLCPDC